MKKRKINEGKKDIRKEERIKEKEMEEERMKGDKNDRRRKVINE